MQNNIKVFLEKYWSLFFVLSAVILVFFLGGRMLFNGDFFFLSDQGRDYLLTKSIVINHKFTLIGTHSGLGGFFHGPLWLYMLAPIFLLGHGNPLFFAWFYLALAILTVLVGFFLAKILYNKKIAVIFTFILALSPIIWQRISNTIGVNIMPLLYIFLFFFLIKFWRGKIWNFIFVTFLTGLAFQFETASAIVLVPVIILGFFLEKRARFNFKLILFSILSFIISLGTFIFFDLRHQFLMTKSLLNFLNKHQTLKGYLPFQERLSEHFLSLVGVFKSAFFIDQLFLWGVILIIIFFGIIIFDRKNNLNYRKEIFLLFLFPIVTYVFYLFYPYVIWPEYVLGLLIPVALAFSLIFYQFLENSYLKILAYGFILFTIFLVANFLKTEYFFYSNNTTAGSYKNQIRVIKWIFAKNKNKSFSYFVYTPETFTYGADYLFWWKGRTQYNYLPQSIKTNNTYLIMYPSLANDLNAHNFWKKNVLHTNGKILIKKIFKGNIVVEKLSILNETPPVDPNYYQDLIFR